MIYFDNAATGGFKPNSSLSAAENVIRNVSSNPGRSGHRLSILGEQIMTGTLASMGREEAEDKLRALGATVTSSVTKTTTALIVGEKPGKSKLEKAEKLGIVTINEEDFLRLIK